MCVIEDETGHLRFCDSYSRWPLLALTAGALGLCVVALAGCAVEAPPGETSPPLLTCVGCPDPTRIVYSLDNILHVMHGDGSGDVELGIAGNHPSLSHDRTRIVYVGGDDKIWMMNIDGSNFTQVTAGSGTVESDPSFSPDDKKIVFTSLTGNEWVSDVHVTSSSSQLLAAGHWKKLTSSDAPVSSPKFTADGSGVLFQYGVYAFDPGAAVVRIDATSTNQAPSSWQYLVVPVYGATHSFVITSDGTPDESGDGATIAYIEDDRGERNIRTMADDGSHKRALTSDGRDNAPAWGPSGRIVFASNRSYVACVQSLCLTFNGDLSAANLFAMDADGGNVTRLTGTTGQVADPSWR